MKTAEQQAANHLDQRINSALEGLRHLVRDIEDTQKRMVDVGSPDVSGRVRTYADIAARIQMQVDNALPNLMLSSLTTAAFEADLMRLGVGE